MKKCLRCLIQGRVQGVFFRASTQAQAQRLNLTGWARNLPGGGVAVLACGEEAALDTLRAWLRHGPPAAKVESLECLPGDPADCPADFTTG